ncbi:MAG: PQQ-dependent sugar dehydrogenase [Candidatus Hydrogenedentes bacterium]|nr:PQQ-dependent sugar dehydrogenase [Candidatus Hydrogenedentota bacterium]
MLRNHVSFFSGLAACALALVSTGGAHAQLDPEAGLKALEPGEGLEVSLFAADEHLVNPTAIDIDAQGRVWVTEAANYRLFKHPTVRATGDRVRVLEDTDGDGRCDKATTFYEDPSVQAPLGVAVLGDRVYICQSPELYYLEDTDGDLKADKKTVVLTGFGGVDHDHAIHGAMIGPDGFIYMTVGDGGFDITDGSGRRQIGGKGGEHPDYDAATVLRVDLDGRHLEVLAEGMRNPYEPTVDSFGNVYGSDNDDDGNEQVQINYVVEGGHYGYWPRRQGDRHLDEVHWNKDRAGVMPNMIRTGFGSPTGILFYEGENLPQRLRNTLIHADAGPGVIRSYRPVANGAGFKGEMEVILSAPSDKWFRPSDVCAAPDGSIFVADWYDPGVGGHNMGDTTRGRIYRLAAKDSKYTVPALDVQTDAGLSEAFTSPNLARRYLAQSRLRGELAGAEVPQLHHIYQHKNPAIRARALWLLAEEKNHGLETLLALAKDESPAFRVQAVRLLAKRGMDSLYQAPELLDDKDPMVRRQILIELRNAPDSETLQQWLVALALQYDGKDRFYREAIGIAFRGKEAWGYEQLASKIGERWDERFAGIALQLHPVAALPAAKAALENGALGDTPRKAALDVIDAIGTEEAGRILVAQVLEPASPELYSHALHHLGRNAGIDWQAVTAGEEVDGAIIAALTDPVRGKATGQFVADTGRQSLAPTLVARAVDPKLAQPARLEALAGVTIVAPKVDPSKADELVGQLAALLQDGGEAMQEPALAAIEAFRGSASQTLLLGLLKEAERPLPFRIAAVRQLANARTGALGLLGLVESNELPEDLTPEVRELVHASPFEDVQMMAQQLLPRDLTADGKALPPMEELVAMTGDPAHGREVFFSEDYAQCHRCHQVAGEGKVVGPDLSTIGQKAGREALLQSILYPSAAISHEYEVWILETEWDGLLSGFVVGEDENAVQFKDASGAVKPIKKADILDRRKSKTSLMPTGLAAAMSAQDLSDLVAYLTTLK